MFNPIINFVISLTEHLFHISDGAEKNKDIFHRYDINGKVHDLDLFSLFNQNFGCITNSPSESCHDIKSLITKLLEIFMKSSTLLNTFNMNSFGHGTYLITNLLEGKNITRKNIRRSENDIFCKKSISSGKIAFLKSIKAHSKPSFCIAFDNNSKFIITVTRTLLITLGI